MATSDPETRQALALDGLAANPGQARLPRPAWVFRYHTPPPPGVHALDTITMADHDDAVMRETELRPCEEPHCLELLVCGQARRATDEVWAYAQALSDLLAAHTSSFPAPAGTSVALRTLVEEAGRSGTDMIIIGEIDKSLSRRMLRRAVDGRIPGCLPCSLLVARRPRWPLRRLLLIVGDGERDEAALDWIARLARLSGAAVTLLAVVPPVPAMYQGMARMQHSLTTMLDEECSLGLWMRRATQRLSDWKIKSTLRLRQGPPDWLIQREAVEGDYDLVAVAAERRRPWLRWLLGETIAPVLRWVDRPVLVA